MSAPPLPDTVDTIVAVSTAAGVSPRGTVRWSGARVMELLREMLAPDDIVKAPRENYRAFSAKAGWHERKERTAGSGPWYDARRPRSGSAMNRS